jgi:hypothetical protein
MARVYSTQFVTLGVAVAPYEYEYSVPAGYLAIIRDVDVFWRPTTLGGALTILNQVTAAIWYSTNAENTAQWQGWRGRQVIPAAGTFAVNILAGTCDVTVSGYLLSLP